MPTPTTKRWWKISLAIRDKFGEKAVHINVTSFGRIVLTGEAPSEEVRQEIQKIAQAQKTARDVRNEIVVEAADSPAELDG
ncbi:MAG: BON domain-containing protein [Burkholderiales bacterium]